MLQRIQTVYWGLTIMCLSVLLSGLDLVVFQKDQLTFKLSLYSLKQSDEMGNIIKESTNYNFVLVVMIIVLTLFTIFQYKNLKKQLNLAKWLMFFNLFISFMIIIFSFTGMIVSDPAIIKLNFCIALLLISFIFSVLAYLGVKKDKSLLDSVDRIR
jgi:hypothetical protein